MAFRQIAAPSLGRRLSNIMVAPSSAEPETHREALAAYYQKGGNGVHLHGEGGETHSRRETGAWLAENHLRPEFFVVTQICHDAWDERTRKEILRFTPEAVQGDIETDSRLIGTEYLDLVYFDDRPDAPLEPVLDAVFAEIGSGRIRAFGVRNMAARRIRAANAYAASHSALGVSAVVTTELSPFTATRPLWPGYAPFDDELRSVVCEQGLTVFAHAGDVNLGQCLFGDEQPSARARSEWVERWDHPENAAKAARIRELANAQGRTTREMLLAWLLDQPFPIVAIVGAPVLLAGSVRYEEISCGASATGGHP